MWGIIRYVQSFSPQPFVRKPKPMLQNFPWLAWEFLAANKTHNHLIFPQQLFSRTLLHLQKIHNNLRHQWERKFYCFYLSLFTLMILDYFLLRALRLSNSIYEISCKRSKTYYSYIFHITLSYTKYIQFGHIKQV